MVSGHYVWMYGRINLASFQWRKNSTLRTEMPPFRINSREFSEARTVGEQHDTRPPNVDSGINPSRIASFVVQKRASSPHFHNLQLHVNPSIGQPRTNQVHTSWTQRCTQRPCSPHNLCLNPRQQTSRARKR